MIRLYSLLVLCYDIFYLAIFTAYSILQTLYRIVCPRPSKSVQDEVAVVSGIIIALSSALPPRLSGCINLL